MTMVLLPRRPGHGKFSPCPVTRTRILPVEFARVWLDLDLLIRKPFDLFETLPTGGAPRRSRGEHSATARAGVWGRPATTAPTGVRSASSNLPPDTVRMG